MKSPFRHAALVGKYNVLGSRQVLDEVARFLIDQGLEVSMERQTALNTGLTDYGALTPDELGKICDIAVVVGGDGTMLGMARQMARHGIPLVGINQGRLGFITDIPIGEFATALAPMIAGRYEEERRTMLEGGVWRDGEVIFEAFALNDVVVSRGATSSMVELKIDIGKESVTNLRADGLIIASPGQMVDVDDLFAVAPTPSASVTLSASGELKQATASDIDTLFDELQKRGLSLDALEDALIQQAVDRAGGNLSAAARSLGLTRPQLSYRLQKMSER
jgi:hypothetical protein